MDSPYDAVESCDAKEVPFWGYPAPELMVHSVFAFKEMDMRLTRAGP